MSTQQQNALLADKRPLLSPRENEVLDCILSGYLHKETAYELGISESTVKVHVTAIRRAIAFPKGEQFRTWMREQHAGR